MAPKRIDDTPLFVRSDWSTERRNAYADSPSIADLAAIALNDEQIRDALAGFAISTGRKLGYGSDRTGSLRSKILALRMPEERAQAAVQAISRLSEEYAAILADGQVPQERKERLKTDFTSALCEAIAFQLLVRNGRAADDIVKDASFLQEEEPIAKNRNVDFFHSFSASKWAEVYECKTDVKRLLERYFTRNAHGNKHTWEKTKLFLMLRVREILVALAWDVHLGCITLHGKAAVDQALRLVECPPELTIHAREALGTTFPPPLPG